MTLQEKIRLATVYGHLTQAEVAQALETSPQNFGQRLKNGKFTLEEMQKIAEAVGAEWIAEFRFPDGQVF